MTAPARRWIRLDVGWDESEWLIDLPAGARLACVLLLGDVKRDGVNGRMRALSAKAAARRWRVEPDEVEGMLGAAEADGALVLEAGTWRIANWAEYQKVDGTATERKRRQRAREREELGWPENPKCAECPATEDLTWDHIIPRSKGGTDEPHNLRILCRTCNSSRQDRDELTPPIRSRVIQTVTRDPVARTHTETETHTDKEKPQRVAIVERSYATAEYSRFELLEHAKRECGMGKWSAQDEREAASVLTSWYGEGKQPGQIFEAIHGARLLVDAGKVRWEKAGRPTIRPRQSFGLKALRNTFTLGEQDDGEAKRPFFDVAREAFIRAGTGPPARTANTGPERIAVNPKDYLAQGSST